MAKNERRRQAKIEKRRAKKADEKKSAQSREVRAQAAEKQRMRQAYCTTAFCWPTIYRKMFFDQKPDLSEWMDFSGADLHLEIYPSQEDRRGGRNGEVVSALRVDKCHLVQVPNAPPDEITVDCSGVLAEKVSKSSVYGQWFRKQWAAVVTVPDEDEYQEVPINFQLLLRKINASDAKRHNRFLASIGHLPYTAGTWNVVRVFTPDSFGRDGNAMEIERLEELLHMLRIWTPILLQPNYQVAESKQMLLAQIEHIERVERKAMEALVPYSQECEKLLAAFQASQPDFLKAQEVVKQREAAHLEAKASFEAAEAVVPQDVDKVKRERKRMNHLRDLWLSAKQSFLARASEHEQAEHTISMQFVEAMTKEFAMANEATLAFLQWQRVSILLSLVS
ncbi:MAG: hypothetical protein U0136_22140 [Bdellovibrionota bacterium]